MIELKKVSKKYKNNILYEDVNISIESGKCVGIIGSNGTGKSVLFKMITGLVLPDKGEIYVNGKRVGKDMDFPEDVGILVDNPGYIEYYSGFKNLQLLAEIQNKVSDHEIRSYMKMMELDPDDKTKVKSYSMGMKQKLGIIQAVMEDQSIIMLDEPFNALDFKTSKQVHDLIAELNAKGKTLILTSHQQRNLEKLCSEMYVILENKLVRLTDEIKAKYFLD